MSLTEDSPAQREAKREKLMEERVRRESRVDGQLASHEQRLNSINSTIQRTGERLGGVETAVTRLSDAVERREAVAKALAAQQVTSRTLVFGLIGAVCTIGLLMVGALSLAGHI